jgi:hypothetical protein
MGKAMSRIRLCVLGVASAGILAAGCSDREPTPQPVRPPASSSAILSRYDQLALGMTKAEAEAVVGRPLGEPLRQTNGEEECWYLGEREAAMAPGESPWGAGGIVITYKDGELVDKACNYQWVKQAHRRSYEYRSSMGVEGRMRDAELDELILEARLAGQAHGPVRRDLTLVDDRRKETKE